MSDFAGAKILITGGLGFIGSNLARRLAGMGGELTLVDSLIPDYGGNLFNIQELEDRVHINISDVRDTYSMSREISAPVTHARVQRRDIASAMLITTAASAASVTDGVDQESGGSE